jgi:hypothetical protein
MKTSVGGHGNFLGPEKVKKYIDVLKKVHFACMNYFKATFGKEREGKG